MIRMFIAVAMIALGANLAHAQNSDAIEKRIKAFKSMLPDLKIGKAMIQGKQPFDAAAAKKVFTTYASAAATLKTLFPDNSKTGAETRALPSIWENKADFDAKMAKFEAESKEAAGAVADLASFKASWGKVMANCGGCHKPYRLKKK
ncbi:MAG: cytochrome c [Hyphomicrobiaceae bacterium]|nr:cytochrome c [Hyphomicrobiaceae bacterium]